MPKNLKAVYVEERVSKNDKPYSVLVLEFDLNGRVYKYESFLSAEQQLILSLVI